jgi:hypothetical protein
MIVELSEGHGRRTHLLKAEYAVRALIWLGDISAGWCVTGVWRKLQSHHGSRDHKQLLYIGWQGTCYGELHLLTSRLC